VFIDPDIDIPIEDEFGANMTVEDVTGASNDCTGTASWSGDAGAEFEGISGGEAQFTATALGETDVEGELFPVDVPFEGNPFDCPCGCPTGDLIATAPAPIVPAVSVSCTADLAIGNGGQQAFVHQGSCVTNVDPDGGSFSWSANSSRVSLGSGGDQIIFNSSAASASIGDTQISVSYSVNGQSSTANSLPITVHRAASLRVVSDSTDPTGQSWSPMCLLHPGDGTCNVSSSSCAYNSFLRTRSFDVLDQFGTAFSSYSGLTGVFVSESVSINQTSCSANVGIVQLVGTQSAALPFADEYSMGASCCLPGGPGCSTNASQQILVDGWAVRNQSEAFTCTGVVLNP